jgi:bifunctional DNA-binding transcriptional regulator/antitoxin component of YhaV-PrlF toxin-antitoxin module
MPVVRDDMSVPISEEMAEKMGLHPGSPIQWERTADGGYVLRPALTRKEAARQLHGMLAHMLKPGESAVADLIREREEDASREQ